MAKTTIYSFARACMKDKEFNCGGIIENERRYLDAIGLEYTVDKDGCIESGDDLCEFYTSMYTLWRLNKKYAH